MLLHLPEVIHVTSARVSLACISHMILTRAKEPGTYGTAGYPGGKWKNKWIVMSAITLSLHSGLNLMSTARFWEKLPLTLSEKESKQCSPRVGLEHGVCGSLRSAWELWVLLCIYPLDWGDGFTDVCLCLRLTDCAPEGHAVYGMQTISQ